MAQVNNRVALANIILVCNKNSTTFMGLYYVYAGSLVFVHNLRMILRLHSIFLAKITTHVCLSPPETRPIRVALSLRHHLPALIANFTPLRFGCGFVTIAAF